MRRDRAAAFLACALMLAPTPARAYVRTTTASGRPYLWAQRCIPLEVYLGGLAGVTDADMRAAVTAAARAWSAAENPCTDLRLALSFRDGPGPAPTDDGHNVLGARPDGWCQPDAAAPEGATCHSPSALAATTGAASSADGQLLDSDTELNTLAFSWAVLDERGQPATGHDLQAAVTHELGHLLGFDHPCWSGVGPRALDDNGAPVPDCYGAPAEIAQDTMFPSAEPGDTSKRALSADARRGLCEVYAARSAATPPACDAPSPAPAGCAAAGRAQTPPRGPSAIVLALVLLAGRRSARRRSKVVSTP